MIGLPAMTRMRDAGGVVTTRRGPYKPGLEKRAQILAAALQEFSRAGFEAASLRAIAARVNITQAGLLHHFGSKQELLLAVLAAQEDEGRAFHGAHGAPLDLDDVLASLLEWAGRHLLDPSWTRLWVSLKISAGVDTDHVAHEYVTRRSEAWIEELTGVLDAAQARGEVRPGLDCRSAAVGILALQEGLFIQSMADGRTDIRRSLEWTVDQMRPAASG